MRRPPTRREFDPAASPPSPPRPLALLALLSALAITLPLAACRHRYGVENREAAVHVWLEAPAALAADAVADVTVTVGGKTAANGTYRFAAGFPLQQVSTVYVPSGAREVVVSRGGTRLAAATLRVSHVAFVRVRIEGGGARVIQDQREPGSAR